MSQFDNVDGGDSAGGGVFESPALAIGLRACQVLASVIAVAVLAPSSASYEKLVSEDPAVTLPPQNTGDYSSTGFLIAVIAVSLAWSAAISAANVFGFGYSSNQLPSAAIFIDAFLSFALLSGASASSGMLSGLREAGFAFCTLVGNKSSGFCAKIIAGIFFSFVGWIAHVASLLKNLQLCICFRTKLWQLLRNATAEPKRSVLKSTGVRQTGESTIPK